MVKNATKRGVDGIRVLSYVFLLLQWLWVIILYSAVLVETGTLQAYIETTQTTSPQQETSIELPVFIRQLLAGTLLVSMIALSLILLVRVPRRATQMTIRATKVTAKSITPTVKKIAHVPKKQRKQLAESVLTGVTAFFSVLACGLILPILPIISLPPSVAWYVSIWLLGLTLGTLVLSVLVDFVSRRRTR